jgi:hypothetical protein
VAYSACAWFSGFYYCCHSNHSYNIYKSYKVYIPYGRGLVVEVRIDERELEIKKERGLPPT